MAATFGGTSQKCKACENTVYLVDQLTADNRVYHKSCFRCHHCKSTLKFSNYNSFEGVLYCKPHYDQLFKMTGSLDRSFEGASRSCKVDRSIVHENQATSKLSCMFTGTQDKCMVCKKTVYPIEKVAIDGSPYHKARFRGDFRQLEDKREDITKARPSENPLATGDSKQLEDNHEDITEVPRENAMTTGDSSRLEDKNEDIKLLSENSVADNGAEESVDESG